MSSIVYPPFVTFQLCLIQIYKVHSFKSGKDVKGFHVTAMCKPTVLLQTSIDAVMLHNAFKEGKYRSSLKDESHIQLLPKSFVFHLKEGINSHFPTCTKRDSVSETLCVRVRHTQCKHLCLIQMH